MDVDDPSTWHWTDLWFRQNVGTPRAHELIHLVVDTNRSLPGGTIDPEYGIVDAAAGVWWPEQAKSLVRNANPTLEFSTVPR